MAGSAPLAVQETTTEIARWQDAVSRSFVPLTVHTPGHSDFRARLEGRVSDGVLFSTIRATPHAVERTPSHIATSPGDYVKLTLQLAGTGLLIQDDRTAALTPGDIVLYDTSRPYTLEFGADLAAVVVMFPHRMIDADPEMLRELTAIRIRGEEGFARAVSHFLAGLASALPTLDGPTGLRITHNTMDLIATMVGSELRGGTWADPAAELLFRIDTYINDHLRDPDLGPERIAAANYISTRYLHTLFQRRETTVSQWVRERRLEHVRRDLIDPRRGAEGIAAIAASWGFVDASHFSKVFRAHAGTSPTAYRASAAIAARPAD
ncbi:AraC family transcriptional regulator [Microbacterium immunditiarum]|uniref:AraC-like DNA-binding protein n=1 Tax=Microbacterium immunditiarum TaxID=337480 RepID=A0A7Y9GR45_9MICO|nr:AraC family transcriptional regulator [Microbacterium immunditiarum]NYE21153.1 AraC-like DNA-binding protein [Microbacterium immunditiarum]